MADGVERHVVALPDGKIYHFNIIYNHAKSPLSKTPDTARSKQVTEAIVKTLEYLGFVNNYYHDRDALPGRNVFTELFRVVNGSDYTICVLTLGFVEDCWKRYSQMAAFKRLLEEGQSHKFLPIAVGLRHDDVPQELNVENVLFFETDWVNDVSAWDKLKRVFVNHTPVPEVNRAPELPEIVPMQETTTPEGGLSDEFDGEHQRRQPNDMSIRPSRTEPQNRSRPLGENQTTGEFSVGDSQFHRNETGNRKDINSSGARDQVAPRSGQPAELVQSSQNGAARGEVPHSRRYGVYVEETSIDIRADQARAGERTEHPETDGPPSLAGSSLTVDLLESSIVDRLGGLGLHSFRNELSQDQTNPKTYLNDNQEGGHEETQFKTNTTTKVVSSGHKGDDSIVTHANSDASMAHTEMFSSSSRSQSSSENSNTLNSPISHVQQRHVSLTSRDKPPCNIHDSNGTRMGPRERVSLQQNVPRPGLSSQLSGEPSEPGDAEPESQEARAMDDIVKSEISGKSEISDSGIGGADDRQTTWSTDSIAGSENCSDLVDEEIRDDDIEASTSDRGFPDGVEEDSVNEITSSDLFRSVDTVVMKSNQSEGFLVSFNENSETSQRNYSGSEVTNDPRSYPNQCSDSSHSENTQASRTLSQNQYQRSETSGQVSRSKQSWKSWCLPAFRVISHALTRPEDPFYMSTT